MAPLKYKIDVNTLEQLAAKQLELNEIGVVQSRARPAAIAFDPYVDNRDTGGFILIDRISNSTVGAGLLHAALRRAQNVHWQALDVDKARAPALKHQQPCVLWFTGLSGAGKSTIANLVEKHLHASGRHTYLLDGDNVRHGLNRIWDSPTPIAWRISAAWREVARLMTDAGLIVLVSFISPFRAERALARAAGRSRGVLRDLRRYPARRAERRDPKGLYRKARAGQIRNFTGIDSPTSLRRIRRYTSTPVRSRLSRPPSRSFRRCARQRHRSRMGFHSLKRCGDYQSGLPRSCSTSRGSTAPAVLPQALRM